MLHISGAHARKFYIKNREFAGDIQKRENRINYLVYI